MKSDIFCRLQQHSLCCSTATEQAPVASDHASFQWIKSPASGQGDAPGIHLLTSLFQQQSLLCGRRYCLLLGAHVLLVVGAAAVAVPYRDRDTYRNDVRPGPASMLHIHIQLTHSTQPGAKNESTLRHNTIYLSSRGNYWTPE